MDRNLKQQEWSIAVFKCPIFSLNIYFSFLRYPISFYFCALILI